MTASVLSAGRKCPKWLSSRRNALFEPFQRKIRLIIFLFAFFIGAVVPDTGRASDNDWTKSRYIAFHIIGNFAEASDVGDIEDVRIGNLRNRILSGFAIFRFQKLIIHKLALSTNTNVFWWKIPRNVRHVARKLGDQNIWIGDGGESWEGHASENNGGIFCWRESAVFPSESAAPDFLSVLSNRAVKNILFKDERSLSFGERVT